MRYPHIEPCFSKRFMATSILLICIFSTTAMAATSAEIAEWLQAHNRYRALHGVAPVTWSEAIAAGAQNYANTCPDGHSSSGYGENLARATYDMGRDAVVAKWYNEEPAYDYSNPGFSQATGHFTQVVWKSTTEIGCGQASGCSNGYSNTWVCRYNPPGNYLNQFAENVFPPVDGNVGDSGPGAEEQPTVAVDNPLSLLYLLLTGQRDK